MLTTRPMSPAVRCSLALLLLALPAGRAVAITYTVDRLGDSTVGTCSSAPKDCALRGAILTANAHAGVDTIVLGVGEYVLALAGASEDGGWTGDLDVTDGLLIRGAGPERTVIDGAALDRVLHLRAPGQQLTLRGLTVTGGACAGAEHGGGILAQEGALRLETSWVLGNSCGGGTGGGIVAFAGPVSQRLGVYDSWIALNHGQSTGGIYAACPLDLVRSTVSDNTADYDAGGVNVLGDGSNLVHSTISGNDPTFESYGGGVVAGASELTIDGCTLAGNVGAELQLYPAASVVLSNTIVVGTCSGPVQPVTIGGNLESPGHSCGFGAADLEDVADAGLSPLGRHGGATPAHCPEAGSVAIDHGFAGPNCSSIDQRSLPRPRDGDGVGGAVCDMGAVELFEPGELFVDGFESGYTVAWSDRAP